MVYGDGPTDTPARAAAVVLQAPSAYDPPAHPELARPRQAHVPERLADVFTLEQEDAAGIATTP